MSAPSLSRGPNISVHDILELPRPSAAVPNPSGTLALWPNSTFSFAAADRAGRTEKELYLVHLPTGCASQEDHQPKKLLGGLAQLDVAWLDDRTFVFLRPAVPVGQNCAQGQRGERVDHPHDMGDKAFKRLRGEWSAMDGGEGTEVCAFDVVSREEYKLGQFPVPISDIQIVQVPSSTSSAASEAVFCFSAVVFPDGDLYTVLSQQEAAEQRAAGSDGMVFDSLFVRHWDEWCPTEGQKKQLHFVKLSRNPDDFADSTSEEEEDGFEHVKAPKEAEGEQRWAMDVEKSVDEAGVKSVKPKVTSPMRGTRLECPVGPFGSASDYSLSPTHLLFHSKDPHVNPAWHTRTQVYLVPLSPRSSSDAQPRALTVGTQGACSSPVLSRNGKRAAWLEMREDGYEADRNRVMIMELDEGGRWGATEGWDRSPARIEWSACGERLFLEAEDRAHVKLFVLDVSSPPKEGEKAAKEGKEPTALTHQHSVSSALPLTPDRVLVTSNSLTSPNELSILTISAPSGSADGRGAVTRPTCSVASPPPSVTLTPLASLTAPLLRTKSLHPGEEFYFPGHNSEQVHGWILFPPDAGTKELRRGKKYPLAFLCHGGPQSAWNDGWSTRWNPNAYAAKGYIVVSINRTGSTGFGQDFCDRIKNDWGGAPFQDLVAGLRFVRKAYPEIDGARMASYGGFMQNWIQGHNDAMGFKCLVCHDGVFSLSQTWNATEELYFPEREFGGTPWEVPKNYQKWNPQNFIHNWRTPQLVIHGSKDYRLVEGEGLGVFNTLQRLGIPSRLLVFPSENHWVLSPHNSAKWHGEVFRWIDEWTAAPAASASSAAAAAVVPEQEQEQRRLIEEVQRNKGYAVEYSAGLCE
ncbi:hypothetical protein JCM21900_006156 [Sporobolomyces salmonicolor]